MTRTYEQEMFDFFVDEKRFESLCKIASHLPEIKRQIIQQFWDEVLKNLEARCVDLGGQWKVIRLEPLESAVSKLMLYKSSWGFADYNCPQLAISCERLSRNPFYGPFIHNRAVSLNYHEAIAYFRKLDIAHQYKSDETSWYPFFAFMGLELNSDEDYLQLIPQNRTKWVDKISDLLFNLAQELEADLDYAHHNFRINID